VQQAEAALTAANVDRDRLVITAPADGVIDSLLFEPGERPPAGRPVAVLLTGANPYARAYVSESLRARVAPGDAARVFVDGLAEPIAGRVRWVASEAAFTPYFALTERDRGRLTYLAKIDLDHDGRRLPDGVPVEVEFPAANGQP
jgi:HlyD family secretion protein